jgi:hypothetical protein
MSLYHQSRVRFCPTGNLQTPHPPRKEINCRFTPVAHALALACAFGLSEENTTFFSFIYLFVIPSLIDEERKESER